MPLNPDDIKALQIAFLVPTTIGLVLKMVFLGEYFSSRECANFIFMGICVGFLLQFLIMKLNHLITSNCASAACSVISTVCSCCSCTSFIIVSGVYLGLSTFEEEPPSASDKTYNFCDHTPKLAIGLELVAFAVFPVGVGLGVANCCRSKNKKLEDISNMEFSFTFLRLVYSALN